MNCMVARFGWWCLCLIFFCAYTDHYARAEQSGLFGLKSASQFHWAWASEQQLDKEIAMGDPLMAT